MRNLRQHIRAVVRFPHASPAPARFGGEDSVFQHPLAEDSWVCGSGPHKTLRVAAFSLAQSGEHTDRQIRWGVFKPNTSPLRGKERHPMFTTPRL